MPRYHTHQEEVLSGKRSRMELKQVQYKPFFLISRVFIIVLFSIIIIDKFTFNYIETLSSDILYIVFGFSILLYKFVYGFLGHYTVIGKIKISDNSFSINNKNYYSDIKLKIRSVKGDTEFWQYFLLYFYFFYWPKTSMGIYPDGVNYIEIKQKRFIS